VEYGVIALLILAAYTAMGVFVNAVVVSFHKYDYNIRKLIVLFWPILVGVLVIGIIPVALGRRVGNFIKEQIKD
jgi:hypothetical protein